MVLPGSPPHQEFPTEKDSPNIHIPRKKRPEPIIDSDKGAEASPGHVGKTGEKTGSEEPITRAPERLPDSPFCYICLVGSVEPPPLVAIRFETNNY